jgi:hypothetical protein
MRRRTAIVSFLLFAALAARPAVRAQQVIDRIVARIEDDIILLSEVRELGRYQQLVDGHSASDDKLLGQLIDQWVVDREATAAHFVRPVEGDIRGELGQLEKQFKSAEAYRARLRELGLSEAAVRRFIERQLYLSRYLDYKFRPAAQVDSAAVEKYYREELLPQLAARGQQAPPLDSVQDQIRELLTQREISARAAHWLDESRSRLKIETQLTQEKTGVTPK